MMGILKKPLIAQYWSKNPLYSTPLFGSVMSQNRFQLLLSMLHFNDNTQQLSRDDPLRDKLFKLSFRPVVDHLFEHFQLMYSMSQNVCIDESLLLWKGRLHFKQYIPIKRSRFGVKLFKLCENSSGYIYRFRVYVGKDSLLQFPPGVPQPPTQFGPTERVVWFLMLPILKKGHHLYVDNYYTSIPLFTALLNEGTGACGTIRANRRGYPQQLVRRKQRPGETSSLCSGALLAQKFTDKDGHMLSTVHEPNFRSVTSRRRVSVTIDKPVCVLEYNTNMGGVD